MKSFLITIFVAGAMCASAQVTREQMLANPDMCGGVYYAYPVTESVNTAAPKGYKPFYVSHYGRHGSRYLISDKDYSNVIAEFQKAHDRGKLTPLGEDVYNRLQQVWQEAEGRGGELTPLGYRQHAGIAKRMYEAYPEVFAGKPDITAASTQVMRCAHSMFAFVQSLKEQDPSLQIPLESSFRNMYYLCHSEPESWRFNDNEGRLTWKQEYSKFERSKVHPDRLMSSLFNDPDYILRDVYPESLMWGLYWIAVDMQNMETPVRFYDIFEPEELVDLWEVINMSFYVTNSSYPRSDGLNVDNAKNLLRNILETADSYIAEGRNGATLRFGHDGNIVPLSALMRLEGCYGYENDPAKILEAWATCSVSPMASNMQMVFFKNAKGDIIVKVMMNEREVHLPIATDNFPFYRWDDLREYIVTTLDTPSIEYCPADKRQ